MPTLHRLFHSPSTSPKMALGLSADTRGIEMPKNVTYNPVTIN
jgi:hypothetical protein